MQHNVFIYLKSLAQYFMHGAPFTKCKHAMV